MGPRRVAVLALLSLLVGATLYEGSAGERSSVAPTVRPRISLHDGPASLPVAAQGTISATLGAEDPAYRVHPSGGGLRAQNTAQRLSLRFGSSRVQIASGTVHMDLSLRAAGYGTSLGSLAAGNRRVRANRVTYTHRELSEWYSNGPLGLEQGFTIPRAFSGHPTRPLTLSMALSGDVRASLGAGGQVLTLGHSGDDRLRYGGLIATDARGHPLPSWLELHGRRVLLRVDARGARYPVRVDPFVQQGEKLTGAGNIGQALFGLSVALSADGNTALIGGHRDNERVGAAWVFTRSGSTWTQQGKKLTGGGEIAAGLFGDSVALSADGDTALVGGSADDHGVGAAWVFRRAGSTWTQQGEKLTGGGEVGPLGVFGVSVALSSDGTTALIGGPGDNEQLGAAWVFTRSGSTWTQQGEKLTGGGEIGAGVFGNAVALSSDGKEALIGGPGDNQQVGAVWVFKRSGSTWTQRVEKLTGSGESASGVFGFSVALSSDGNTALVGGVGDDEHLGAAWVFTRSGSTWTQRGEKLTGGGEIGAGYFGRSVALSANGNTALIGGPGELAIPGEAAIGAAWLFRRSGSTWTQQGEKLTGGEESGKGLFGHSVALSANGKTALIGGPGDSSLGEPLIGAAWVFVNVPTPRSASSP
jgi:hypothetical protein